MKIMIMALILLIPIASATCYDFNPENVPITRYLCQDNITLEVTRNITIGNETCSFISNISCDNGCNNFTNRCEWFKGEQENMPKIAVWSIIITILIGLSIIIARELK